jgi:hypothetical protein
MFERGRAGLFGHKDECPMGSYRRAALAGVQEGAQVVEVDLPPVPRQDSGCSTHTFDHRTGQRRLGFLAQVDRRLLVRTCPLISVRINRATYRAWAREDLLARRRICHVGYGS